MPGTIHVSVPDFKDLPSSIPPSSILTKVSMGKREYHTWDKGDFSFPLTTLRDNVTITIQDTEGNEISQTVVQILSVVERGSWDEFISLEGGGNVHVRLQFVLSQEERNRIRSMRESAMKKKGGELISNSLGFSETASMTGATFSSSLSINHKVSGGSEETSTAASTSNSLGMDLGDVYHSKSLQNIETNLEYVDLHKRPVLLQEPTSAMKKSLVSSKLKIFQADQPEKQDLLGKTPSNVRKLISAFESSLAKDMRPGIKPPAAVKLQSKDPKSEEMDKPRKPTFEMCKKPSIYGESQQIQTYEVKSEERIGFGKGFGVDKTSKVKRKPDELTYGAKKEDDIASDKGLNGSKSSQDAEQLEEPSTIQIEVNEIGSFPKPRGDLVSFGGVQRIQKCKVNREEHIGFDEGLNRSKSSQKTEQLKEPSITQIQVTETESIGLDELRKRQEDLEEVSAVEAATVGERRGSGIFCSYSHEIDIQGVPGDKVESAALFEDVDFPRGSSGAWIFPDHERRLCITTGSIEVVTGLVEGFGIQERTPKRRNSFSLPEYVEKPNIQPGDYDVVYKGDEISDELRTTQLDNSSELETFNGPLGQAVKVTLMVAFGVLVLLTRQRKYR